MCDEQRSVPRRSVDESKFWITYAKRFPPFVYSTNANGCLIHRVKSIRFRWWNFGPRATTLVWTDKPFVTIDTVCNQLFFVRNRGKKTAQFCEIPKEDAVMCERCNGNGSTFKKTDPYELRKEAHRKLGCLIEVEE